MEQQQPHFLLVTYPAQGHINPALQFANRLIHLGGGGRRVHVTFAITINAHRCMIKSPSPDGLSFATFSDGYDDGFKPEDKIQEYLDQLKRNGTKALTELIVSNANQGRPFTCLVYTLLIPWVAEVARELHLPSTLFWIQTAMVFDIYYYYYNGFADVIGNCNNDPSHSIQLPGLPLLTSHELPSFMLASNTYDYLLPIFQADIEALEKLSKPRVLVNTFDALEIEALKAIEKLNLVAVGPLIPSTYLDEKDQSNGSKDYMEWLNSKPESSVIYVSFGSMSVLMKQQMEEIARGLLDCGRPFLWVIRAKENGEEEKLSCKKELEEKGVPMVAFPQWTDQGTNAKLIEDVLKTGVKVTTNNNGIVVGDEIKRCLELVAGDGERGKEMRRNAMKWKELAREAVNQGGSSYSNLKAFVDECCG
ncbi:phloretin 4'-O-glucosyltransferase-like isoform X2 [Castanea sativa]|uniref:phloretin 4'-O-glucosyltransferase-like isoform X2 n=1 Tax=Castanea sativa TaxID=21020 RepID=UPI003F653C38